MKTIVFSLGGSMIVPDRVNVDYLKSFRGMVLDYTKENRVVIVCGGGKTCRNYQTALGEITEATNEQKDWLGIKATHLNGELVRMMFGDDAYDHVIIDPTEKISTNKRIIIAAGWKPGFSTDMDAVVLAKQYEAEKVLNVSNIDYVYDKDPNVFEDAAKFHKLSWDEYLDIIGRDWKPGMNSPFDPVASKEAKDNGIKAIIIGKDLKNLENCINDKEFEGTLLY
ncbi:UMP kinase [Candidatus Woesearchaeota archaeon]|nr:UMP kinase [Candidatus Woesearchaeota archaeon]